MRGGRNEDFMGKGCPSLMIMSGYRAAHRRRLDHKLPPAPGGIDCFGLGYSLCAIPAGLNVNVKYTFYQSKRGQRYLLSV